MSNSAPLIQKIETLFEREKAMPDFRAGDTIRVQVKIREGEKQRLQAFEGLCIRRSRGGNGSTFTVRKVSYGIGVERIFSDNSPNVDSVKVLSRGKVRQARLYYLRDLRGKAARIKERAYEKGEDNDKEKAGRKKRGTHRKAAAPATATQVAKLERKRKKKDKRKAKAAKSKVEATASKETVQESQVAENAPAAEAADAGAKEEATKSDA